MTGTVAVIGAGPGGLVAARWLLSQGFEPTIFERSAVLGGQWAGLPGRSGVWPGMHTNTSRVLTAFSDVEPTSPEVFPSSRDVLADLHRYADTFGLVKRTEFDTDVEHLGRDEGRWVVRHGGHERRFDRVVVASGRFHDAAIPPVAGLDSFGGSAGVSTTYAYRGPDSQRGQRILVAGCAVSALEVASELAQQGANVVVTQRRQRYVLPKFAAGVPSDHRIFTRYGVLVAESLPTAEVDHQLKEIVVEAGGSPEQYGAPVPDPSLFAAGVTLSQQFLPLIAEGRITVRPWMSGISGRTVTPSTPTSPAWLHGDVGSIRRVLRSTGVAGPVDRLRVGRCESGAHRRRATSGRGRLPRHHWSLVQAATSA